jgi:RHS repeat-associated protein
MTDMSPTTVWKQEFFPFGEWFRTDYALNPNGNNLRFSGQYFDAETGLHQNWFRDYSPKTGRYQEADPIGLRGGANPFLYVHANAVNRVDVFGLEEYPNNFIGPLPSTGYRTSEMTQTRCGRVPPAPPVVDLNANMDVVTATWSPYWFRDHVQNKGPWDYKQLGGRYTDFGNFNYGATGNAFGFGLNRLLREAGRAQQVALTSRPEWGEPGWFYNPWGGTSPYGDDPDDQQQIQNGFSYCDCMRRYP